MVRGVHGHRERPAGPAAGQGADRPGLWGSGKVLTSKMVSALITDDGRVFVGLVTPDTLQAAAAKAPR